MPQPFEDPLSTHTIQVPEVIGRLIRDGRVPAVTYPFFDRDHAVVHVPPSGTSVGCWFEEDLHGYRFTGPDGTDLGYAEQFQIPRASAQDFLDTVHQLFQVTPSCEIP